MYITKGRSTHPAFNPRYFLFDTTYNNKYEAASILATATAAGNAAAAAATAGNAAAARTAATNYVNDGASVPAVDGTQNTTVK